MYIIEDAKKKGIQFADLIHSNSVNKNETLIEIFHEHFLNSRLHLKSWNNNFVTSTLKRLKDLKSSPEQLKMIDDALSFEIVLKEHHYSKIQDIIINKKKSSNLFFNNTSFFSSYKFVLDYKNYFLTKHLYSIIKNVDLLVDNIEHDFNFINFFSTINSKSLTGIIFIPTDSNNFKFRIPMNISTNFMFWNKSKLIGIDTSISEKFDSEILLNHFTYLHILYKKTPKEIQENLKKVQNRTFKSILMKISNNKIIDHQVIKKLISPNVNFVFDIDFDYEYESFSYYKVLSSYLISISKNNIDEYEIPEQLNTIIFNEIISGLKLSDVITKQFREDLLVDILTSFKDYNSLVSNLNILPNNQNYIKNILINKSLKMKELLDTNNLNELKFKNYLFSLGINVKESRELIYNSFINKTILNYPEFKNIFGENKNNLSNCINHLNSDKIRSIINTSIKTSLKDNIIIKEVLKIDSTINQKNLQNKIDEIREKNEIQKMKKMNLNVKK